MTMGVFYGVIEQLTALFHVEQAPGKTSGGLFEKRRKKKKKGKAKSELDLPHAKEKISVGGEGPIFISGDGFCLITDHPQLCHFL